MTAKAIETRYDGYRFRSRLEARWYVFFKALGMTADYETEGYLVGTDRKPYLPDFWLPREKVWVEVKGAEEQLDVAALAKAAYSKHGLPATGRTEEGFAVRMLVLGKFDYMPSPVRVAGEWSGFAWPAHTVLTQRGGNLHQGRGYFAADGLHVMPHGGVVATARRGVRWDVRGTDWGNLVGGGATLACDCDATVISAYRAARSARFEHGEKGAA